MIAESPMTAYTAPDFDSLARLYRWMEWSTFGPYLGLCRRAFLGPMRRQNRALILGDGDGRFTARLLRENPLLRADAVDASPVMLRALVRRTGSHASRLNTSCIDVRQWRAGAATYDLIVTHFFLDCLTTAEVQSLVRQVRAAAAPGALWAVSEFAVPQNRFGRLLAGPLVRALYAAFGWLTGLRVRQLPDHALALQAGGFRLQSRSAWMGGLLTSELWKLGESGLPARSQDQAPESASAPLAI